MDNLEINRTQSSPQVTADIATGNLRMAGDSYPENSFEFFLPIITWVNSYLAQNDETTPLTLDLHLLYLNTSSVKAMMDIFDLLEDAHAEGRSVAVNWYYDVENERIAELAEEFKEDCSFPFEIIQVENKE
jgi:hypothetical protein